MTPDEARAKLAEIIREAGDDISFGLFQQWADEGDHTASPENVALIQRLYFDPAHACAVAAEQYHYWRYNPDVPALTAWVAYNSPGFYHAPEQSPNAENYRRSLAEAQRILGAPEPVTDRLYGPDVPDGVILQQNPWSCAVRSTYAALWAMAEQGQGEPVTYGDEGPRDVYEWMVPGIDDPSVGLHRADGSELVAMLRAHGYRADRMSPAPLSEAQARAGHQPLLIGGYAWQHWVYCRGVEADGMLILENPAPGFAGISDELRDSWDRLGPMTLVWIKTDSQEMEGEVTKAEADALRAENAQLRDQRDSLITGLAVAADNHGDTIQAALDAIRQIRTERVGPRPAA
jgi:hypothetical protein